MRPRTAAPFFFNIRIMVFPRWPFAPVTKNNRFIKDTSAKKQTPVSYTHLDVYKRQAQPCRWGYHLVEEKRPGLYFPIEEDERGSYILNAKDLCMIEHVDKLAAAGISSFKIEGRAKSSYYVSVVTNAYRNAVDLYRTDPAHYKLSLIHI